MSFEDCIKRWTARRDEFSNLKTLVDGAAICDQMLGDLVHLQRAIEQQPLTLEEAAALSGYSREHLGRLVRVGTVPNRGRLGAPRVYAGDLPIKATRQLASRGPRTYDPATDARSLVSRRKGGAHGSSQDSS